MEKLEILQYVPLFQSVPQAAYDAVDFAAHCRQKTYDSGQVIHFPHEKCTHLDVICSGLVLVQALEASGSVITISQFGCGETLGSNLLFSSRPQYPMLVLAKSQVSLVQVDKKALLQLCQCHPVFLEQFLQQISDKALVLTGKINSIALKSIRESVVEYLLLEQQRQKSHIITLPFSKKEWAEMLGVQRPSLSRELRHMQQEGLIQVDNRRIVIQALSPAEP